jgi:hypothetical protein
MKKNSIESISVEEIMQFPVWRYLNRDRCEEVILLPIYKFPRSNLDLCIVGTKLTLANGTQVWSFLGNIDTCNTQSTKHFLTVSVERNGEWFHLARYHDSDYKEHGPTQLAKFLNMKTDSVFPMRYDVRFASEGEIDALTGYITSEPTERLSKDELILLAIA